MTDSFPPDLSVDWKLAASMAYTRERNEIQDILDRIFTEAEQKAKPYESRLAELDAGARTFGFKILAGADQDAVGSAEDAEGGQLFKDGALRALREAYPRPLKAADIRSRVEADLARRFHDKTAGMTLYRLSKSGHVRREGHRWFFVPDSERVQLASENSDAAITPSSDQMGEGEDRHNDINKETPQ